VYWFGQPKPFHQCFPSCSRCDSGRIPETESKDNLIGNVRFAVASHILRILDPAFPHYGFISILQKDPESESVRDEQ
jgi:hypothetical protein